MYYFFADLFSKNKVEYLKTDAGIIIRLDDVVELDNILFKKAVKGIIVKPGQVEILLNHMRWADAEVWKKVLTLKLAENDEKIKKLLHHLHQVQYAFYYLWNELPIEIPKLETFSDFNGMAKWGFEYQQKLDEFLSSSKADENEK